MVRRTLDVYTLLLKLAEIRRQMKVPAPVAAQQQPEETGEDKQYLGLITDTLNGSVIG